MKKSFFKSYSFSLMVFLLAMCQGVTQLSAETWSDYLNRISGGCYSTHAAIPGREVAQKLGDLNRNLTTTTTETTTDIVKLIGTTANLNIGQTADTYYFIPKTSYTDAATPGIQAVADALTALNKTLEGKATIAALAAANAADALTALSTKLSQDFLLVYNTNPKAPEFTSIPAVAALLAQTTKLTTIAGQVKSETDKIAHSTLTTIKHLGGHVSAGLKKNATSLNGRLKHAFDDVEAYEKLHDCIGTSSAKASTPQATQPGRVSRWLSNIGDYCFGDDELVIPWLDEDDDDEDDEDFSWKDIEEMLEGPQVTAAPAIITPTIHQKTIIPAAAVIKPGKWAQFKAWVEKHPTLKKTTKIVGCTTTAATMAALFIYTIWYATKHPNCAIARGFSKIDALGTKIKQTYASIASIFKDKAVQDAADKTAAPSIPTPVDAAKLAAEQAAAKLAAEQAAQLAAEASKNANAAYNDIVAHCPDLKHCNVEELIAKAEKLEQFAKANGLPEIVNKMAAYIKNLK